MPVHTENPADGAPHHGSLTDHPKPHHLKGLSWWRAHGGTTASHPSRTDKTPIGYDYVHLLVDDHSRLAYSEVLLDEKGPTCAAFMLRAADYFTAHGITRIKQTMTDEAWAYRWSLREVVAGLGARQLFIKPTAPDRTGRRKATTGPCKPSGPTDHQRRRAAALAPWLEHYNTQRRHTALGGLPPTSRLTPTS